MGYSYGRNDNGRMVLACDHCGNVGGVRKRTCPHKVTYAEGYQLPYCYPSALCKNCYAMRKNSLHEGCFEGAAKSTAREVERKARLVAGDFEVASAFGEWHPSVPAGMVGVKFTNFLAATLVNAGHAVPCEVWRLIPKDIYKGAGWLSEYETAADWSEHPIPAGRVIRS